MIQESFSLGIQQNEQEITSDDYYTPEWIFQALQLEFDTDPASPMGGIDWIPVKNYFTIVDDGLQQEWKGKVWLNPPYSNPTPWIDRFITHRNGITLVQISKSRWCCRLFEEADAFLFLPYNLRFVTATGKEMGIYMPCGLFAMGKENMQALQDSKIARVR